MPPAPNSRLPAFELRINLRRQRKQSHPTGLLNIQAVENQLTKHRISRRIVVLYHLPIYHHALRVVTLNLIPHTSSLVISSSHLGPVVMYLGILMVTTLSSSPCRRT